ncbi:MAG: glycogen/starch synthase, partial [Candidatus Paceibacterota bacterium]
MTLKQYGQIQRLFKDSNDSMKDASSLLKEKGKKVTVWMFFAVYNELKRIRPASKENPFGEDALRMKIGQLNRLFSSYSGVLDWRLVMVDNGPGAETAKLARELLEDDDQYKSLLDTKFHILKVDDMGISPEERRKITKGGTILYGMKAFKDEMKENDLVGFTDCDITTNLEQLGSLIQPLISSPQSVAIGVRPPDLGAVPVPGVDKEDPEEEVKGRTGIPKQSLFPQLILDTDPKSGEKILIRDTQCGLKLFTSKLIKNVILENAKDIGWSFDTEWLILAVYAGYAIQMVPVFWANSADLTSTNIKVREDMLRGWVEQFIRYVVHREEIEKKIRAGSLMPFAPHSSMPIRYRDLEGSFISDLECALDLSSPANKFTPVGSNSKAFAEALDSSLAKLEELVNNSNDSALKEYLQQILERVDNRAPPIRIRVSSKLATDAARYYDSKTGTTEIIFNEGFIRETLSLQPQEAQLTLAIRLFHELGHSRFINQYQLYKEEYELMKKDMGLYKVLQANSGETTDSLYPAFYLAMLEGYISKPEILQAFDEVISALEEMEESQRKVYDNREKIDMHSEDVLSARRARIQRAFEVADPDFGGSTLSKVKKNEIRVVAKSEVIKLFGKEDASWQQLFADPEEGVLVFVDDFVENLNKKVVLDQDEEKDKVKKKELLKLWDGARTFISDYLDVLGHRGIACGRESFFCLNKEPLGRAPFRYLKNPRIPCPLNAEWKREYFACSKKRRMSDGIGVTEAEDKSGFVQKMHKHPTVERTSYVCTNKGIYYSNDPAIVKELQNLLAAKNHAGAIAYIKEKGIFIRPKFADVSVMPADLMHSLLTWDENATSSDFTIKDPVTQIIKEFVVKIEDKLGLDKFKPSLNVGDQEKAYYDQDGVKIYRRSYGIYNTRLLINEKTGDMLFVTDKEKNTPVPFMYGPVKIANNLVLLEPGASTPRDLPIFRFASLYPEEKTQVLHIFPYPDKLPQAYEGKWFLDFDDAEQELFSYIHKDSAVGREHADAIRGLSRSGYIDHSAIKAEVTTYDAEGRKIESREYEGGDVIILDNSVGASNIASFSIKNISKVKGLDLAFFVLSAERKYSFPGYASADVLSRDGEGSDILMGFAQQPQRAEVREVAYITPEIVPLSKTGGLGDVSGELCAALAAKGVNVSVFTLKYKNIPESKLEDTGIGFSFMIKDEEVKIRIWKVKPGIIPGANVYLLENSPYADVIYEGDQLKQAIVLSQGTFGAIEALAAKGLIQIPQVMHANDWQAALVPVYLKTKYNATPLFQDTVSVFAIHNLAYQGGIFNRFPGDRFDDLGISGEHWFGLVRTDDPASFNLVKGAIFHSDEIVTVSPTYAQEIMNREEGEGLDADLRRRFYDVTGILNRVDRKAWRPVSLKGKPAAKARLQEMYGLDVDPNIPILGSVTRITSQKGTALIIKVVERILKETNGGIQFVFLGKGHPRDSYYHHCKREMEKLMREWPGKVYCDFKNGQEKSKKVFSGLDIYLMPSKFEPCGTKQQVALLNGCAVVARMTGGLIDTVIEFDPRANIGNGFTFRGFNEDEFYDAVMRALRWYGQPNAWKIITRNAKASIDNWDSAVQGYQNGYY